MGRRALYLAAGAALVGGVICAIWLKSRTVTGFHPFLGHDDVDAIAGAVLRQEFPHERPVHAPLFIALFEGDPPPNVLAQVPGAKPVSARSAKSEEEILCGLGQLVSLAPFGGRATVEAVTLVRHDGVYGASVGGGATFYHLKKDGKAWRVERSERTVAW